ncbi:MAG: 16S rRNA (cytosine(1402)-N(4))-methyltransferase RsmH [Clostridia bacterium]
MDHYPVMLKEVIKYLDIKPDGVYVDCTLGRAGHSSAIFQKLEADGKLIAFDQDIVAIDEAKKIFKNDPRVTLIHNNFKNIDYELAKINIKKVDGILIDLGVSSPQLDNPERGFSYRQEGILDMRMDQSQDLDASKVVNEYSKDELAKYIYKYGEERRASKIAYLITEARKEKRIETTTELAEIIKKAFSPEERQSGHPARRTFQAIRILVNQELKVLEDVLPQAIDLLRKNGRICVLTFHSLEDRIVKSYFKSQTGICTCPPDFPICVCGKEEVLEIPSGQPYYPSDEEIEINSRSRSAKLRVAIKK